MTKHVAVEGLGACPISISEELRFTEAEFLKSLASGVNRFHESDAYAQATGTFLNNLTRFQLWQKTFFPFMPQMDVSAYNRMIDDMEWNYVEARRRYFDQLDLMQGKPAKSADYWETWRRVRTTPGLIAQSKKELVWKKGIIELYRYTPPEGAAPLKRIPLLLVFAVMNTPWVLDLYPGHSFVEYMSKMGYDVYLVNWGCPTRAEKNWNFSTYALVHLPQIVAKVKALSGSEEFSMLGWCLGAIISTIYAAMRPGEGLRNFIPLTAPLDFPEGIEFGTWLKYIDVPQLLAANDGLMPEEYIKAGSQHLKLVENDIGNKEALSDHLEDPRFVAMWSAMNAWLGMNVPMPGGFYLELVEKLYLSNQLTAGKFQTTEGLVKLGNVRANLLALVAESDHITPPPQTLNAIPLFGSKDKTVLRKKGGHVGVMAGRAAEVDVWPGIDAWLSIRSM